MSEHREREKKALYLSSKRKILFLYLVSLEYLTLRIWKFHIPKDVDLSSPITVSVLSPLTSGYEGWRELAALQAELIC